MLTLTGTSERPRAGSVGVTKIEGWTLDGRVVLIGGPPAGYPGSMPDVYTAAPGGGIRNVTSTPGEFENAVAVAR